jgi:hypothetical protein
MDTSIATIWLVEARYLNAQGRPLLTCVVIVADEISSARGAANLCPSRYNIWLRCRRSMSSDKLAREAPTERQAQMQDTHRSTDRRIEGEFTQTAQHL